MASDAYAEQNVAAIANTIIVAEVILNLRFEQEWLCFNIFVCLFVLTSKINIYNYY